MKRLSVFVHWDRDHVVAPYVITYIQGLQTVSHDIIFVSNCPINEQEQQKIKPFVSSIVIRENKGLDFGAWKQVLLSHGLASIANTYDELVLANSSCFAPLFPFQEMFDAMKKKHCDFWGITENKTPKLVREDGSTTSILPHIQSYFLVFNKKVMQSFIFNQFWSEFNENHEKDDVIINGETALTDLLLRAGFQASVYLPFAGSCDHSILSWHRLIQRRCPTLKVKIFSIFISNRPNWLIMLFRCQKIIAKSGSQYDYSLIESYLKRCHPNYMDIFFRYKKRGFIFRCISVPFKIFCRCFFKIKKITSQWLE